MSDYQRVAAAAFIFFTVSMAISFGKGFSRRSTLYADRIALNTVGCLSASVAIVFAFVFWQTF